MRPLSRISCWRNAGDAQQIEVGWWPGDARYPKAAFYGFAFPAEDTFSGRPVAPGSWNAELGEFILDSEGATFEDALAFFGAAASQGEKLGEISVCSAVGGITEQVLSVRKIQPASNNQTRPTVF